MLSQIKKKEKGKETSISSTAGCVCSVLMIKKTVLSCCAQCVWDCCWRDFQADIKLCIWLHLLVMSLSLSLSLFCFALNLSIFLGFSYCPCLLQQLCSVPFNKIRPTRKHSKEINMASSVLTIHSASLLRLRHSASSYFVQAGSPLSDSGSVSIFLSNTTRWEWNWQILKRKGSAKLCWVSVAFYSDHADKVIWPLFSKYCRTSRR